MRIEFIAILVFLIVIAASVAVPMFAVMRSRGEEQDESNAKGKLLWICLLVTSFGLFGIVFVFIAKPFWSRHEPAPILFDEGRAALFESFEHATNHAKFIEVYGATESRTNRSWGTQDAKKVGYFSYKTNANLKVRPSGLESSGGYITFYAEPRDKLFYRLLVFKCKAATSNNNESVDMGVRLAVDNPDIAGDRELVTYELKSLKDFGGIQSDWRIFKIPLAEFRPVNRKFLFPPGLDANKINKLVFFLDTEKVKACPTARLYIGDVEFVK